jgi:hypothetical protein
MQNGQKNQRTDYKEQKDKKVPMCYQIQKLKETNTVELKYTDIDRLVDKTKLHIYENGMDEELLKLVKEFQNYINTYKIWGDRNTTHTIYHRCLAGAAQDRWDLINVFNESKVRDNVTFQFHI